MTTSVEIESFRAEVEAAARDDYALLHKEIRLYLESWAIAKARVVPMSRRAHSRPA